MRWDTRRVSVADLRPALRLAYFRSGLTRGQLAARAEVSEHTVDRILAGKSVHTESLDAVAGALGFRVTLIEVSTLGRMPAPATAH